MGHGNVAVAELIGKLANGFERILLLHNNHYIECTMIVIAKVAMQQWYSILLEHSVSFNRFNVTFFTTRSVSRKLFCVLKATQCVYFFF